MKAILFLMALLTFFGSALAEGESVKDRLFSNNGLEFYLNEAGLNATGQPAVGASENPDEDLNPGKALFLSALIPGAGQYYAGSRVRAAIFFALEVAAWTGVIYYYDKEKDKTKEFEKYANDYFDEDKYRVYEFEIARSPSYGDSGAYKDTDMDAWTALEWDQKITYLPATGFTHELPDASDRSNKSHLQQYYEMIGKYITQFGDGWADHDNDLEPDDPNKTGWQGDRTHSLIYMDKRYRANRYGKYSSYAIQIVMLNHIAAALEASFEVR
ncbi:hypothetical protein H8D57_00195, partial [bacterium]|nr:hypothetical protein [bacterium]